MRIQSVFYLYCNFIQTQYITCDIIHLNLQVCYGEIWRFGLYFTPIFNFIQKQYFT
jgi:hypothetical protein